MAKKFFFWTLSGLNQWYRPTENQEQSNKNDRLDSAAEVKQKNDLHVKIQLPDETLKKTIEKPIKKRKCQSCCMKLFIIILFLIVLAILGFFIGKLNFFV